jgi:ribosomal protein L11 methyltransferase
MTDFVRLELRATPESVDAMRLFLSQNAAHGWEEESLSDEIVFRVHLEEGPAAENLVIEASELFPGAGAEVVKVERRNWNEAWQEFFKPIAVDSDLTVVPSWLSGTTIGREIVIHPAMAFGTGHHATTMLCLRALSELKRSGELDGYETFLDLGAGSGILAIAAGGVGLTGVGLDIDPAAVENARLNVKANDCEDRVALATGGLDTLRAGSAFDLVMANILAGTLKDMAADLAERIAPGGTLILSGILREQVQEVAGAYALAGLGEPTVKEEGEWSALVYRAVDDAT